MEETIDLGNTISGIQNMKGLEPILPSKGKKGNSNVLPIAVILFFLWTAVFDLYFALRVLRVTLLESNPGALTVARSVCKTFVSIHGGTVPVIVSPVTERQPRKSERTVRVETKPTASYFRP